MEECVQLPPLLLERIQRGSSSRTGQRAALSARSVTSERVQRPDHMKSARPDLHSEWQQVKIQRDLRRRLQRKLNDETAADDDDDSDGNRGDLLLRSDIDFAEIGQRIADRMRMQGVVFRSQLDIAYTIEALESVWLQRPDGIEEEDFVRLLSKVLSTDPKKLSTMFQKMDANADGSIEWDEFLSYLLKEATHNWDRSCEQGRRYLKQVTVSHQEMNPARAMLVIPSANHAHKYAILCDDRTIRIVDSDTLQEECTVPLTRARNVILTETEALLQPHNAHVAARERVSRHKEQFNTIYRLKAYKERSRSRYARDLDVPTPTLGTNSLAPAAVVDTFSARPVVPVPSCMVYDEYNSEIVVASYDRSVSFYSSSFDRRHQLQFSLDRGFYVTQPPQCIDVANLDRNMLFVGDAHGSVSMFAQGHSNYDEYQHVHKSNVHNGECVRKVMLLPNIGVVSAGMDTQMVITDTEKWEVVRRLTGHRRGVYGMASCPQNRLLVSIGYDAKILIWDPYISQSTGQINGHHLGVIDIIINEKHNQLITATVDCKINVYDIRTWTCIQSLVSSAGQKDKDDPISALIYDPHNEVLVGAGTRLKTWEVVSEQGDSVKTGVLHRQAHHSLIVAICFSSIFKQIISVTVDERVCLWDVFTGARTFEYVASHNSPITAACLDHRGKRLITTAQNGTVKMWNFNNGACMHEYARSKREISTLLYLPNAQFSTLGAGIGTGILRWADPSTQATTPLFVHSDHRGDALCLAYIHDLFASGSSDGEVIIWYANSAIIRKRFRVPSCTEKAAGICKMRFLTVSNTLLGFIGTDDGSLHVVETRTWTIVASHFKALSDVIVGIDGDEEACRLLVCDANGSSKIWDIQAVTPATASTHMLLVRAFRSVGERQTVTSSLYCPDVQAFIIASDAGAISLWSLDGMEIAQLGQTATWPIGNRSSTPPTASPEPNEQALQQAPDEGTSSTTIAKAAVSDGKLVSLGSTANRLSAPRTLQPKGLRSYGFIVSNDNDQKQAAAKKTTTASQNDAVMLAAALQEMTAFFTSGTPGITGKMGPRQGSHRRQKSNESASSSLRKKSSDSASSAMADARRARKGLSTIKDEPKTKL